MLKKTKTKKSGELVLKKNPQALVSVIAPEELLDYIRLASSPWKTFLFNFLRGTAQGVGLILGTAIVLAIVFKIADQFVTYPVIGEWLQRIGENMALKK
ncbi:MAG TPA: DUF5665 domain-containing protein [Patescibacteria group bacterium]|nr:DUF5665 domain-containing protein [Patescibacteria group bacterium]